jgi:outer membrane protein TolC
VDSPPAGSISQNAMGEMGASAPKTSMAVGSNMTGEMGGGRSGLVDVLRLRMKILEMENTKLLLADTKRTVRAQFNRLLNRPLDAEVVLGDSIHIESLPLPILEIPDSIIAHYPMLQMLAAEEAAFGASERMNRRMGFPMIGLGAQYGILRPRVGNTNPMNGRDMWMPMVSMNLPIWRKKYRASVAEAGLKRQAAAEALLETQNAVMVTYEEAMKDYQDAQRRRTLFVKQTLLAEEALNILMASYGAGGDDFEEVLQIQQSLLNYRLANVKATVEQNVSVARLERLMGR